MTLKKRQNFKKQSSQGNQNIDEASPLVLKNAEEKRSDLPLKILGRIEF